MRIAIAGKGGSGKITLPEKLCRTRFGHGRKVFASDADRNPDPASAPGLPGGETGAPGYPPATPADGDGG